MLAAPFLLIDLFAHIIWNTVALALSGGLTPLVITGLDVEPYMMLNSGKEQNLHKLFYGFRTF